MAQAQSNNIVSDGIDRIQSAMESAQSEIEKFQKDIDKRRKRLEKRASKEMKRIQKDIRTNPTVKRANKLQKEVTSQIETSLDSLLGGLQIASRRDVAKLDKKLNKISRKLTALDKSMGTPDGKAVAAK